MLIALAIKLGILGLGVFIYLAMPEKASMMRLEQDRYSPGGAMTIMSLEPDRPFRWAVGIGDERRRNVWRQNPYDASRLRIVCRDETGQDHVHEPDLPAGPSRLVVIRPSGCGYMDVRSTPLPRF